MIAKLLKEYMYIWANYKQPPPIVFCKSDHPPTTEQRTYENKVFENGYLKPNRRSPDGWFKTTKKNSSWNNSTRYSTKNFSWKTFKKPKSQQVRMLRLSVDRGEYRSDTRTPNYGSSERLTPVRTY